MNPVIEDHISKVERTRSANSQSYDFSHKLESPLFKSNSSMYEHVISAIKAYCMFKQINLLSNYLMAAKFRSLRMQTSKICLPQRGFFYS